MKDRDLAGSPQGTWVPPVEGSANPCSQWFGCQHPVTGSAPNAVKDKPVSLFGGRVSEG